MQIMQKLPTSKPSFPFKHTEDFNQTKYVAPYEHIFFIDNISFNFISLSFIHEVFKGSHHGNIDHTALLHASEICTLKKFDYDEWQLSG